MDLFEFILIITSVVYALAIAQILSGVGRLTQTEAAIRWFVPHTVWVAIIFIQIPLSWWAGWEFRGVEWVFPKFLYTFITPTFLFLSTSLIIPQRVEGQEIDLERHFFKIRRPVLWSFFIAMLAQFVDGPLLLSEPLWFPGRIGQIAVLCAILGVAYATNRRLQTALSIGSLLYLTYVILTRLWMPG